MAKPIFIPQDEADRIIAALRAQLSSKCCGSINIKPNLKSDDRCALLYFTPTAWIKMTALVSEFTTEVQWHGLVRRLSDCEFEIYDIIVPPHTVTASTVTSDQEKYSEWINGLDDETFSAVRFHGHSHVNMPVSPSVTDTDYRKDIITQLPKPDNDNDVFYIFLIINKRHEWSAEIYDLTYDALYSTSSKEIDLMMMLDDGDTIDNFISEAKKVAVVAQPTAYKGAAGAQGGKSYGGSYGNGSSFDGRTYGSNSYGNSYANSYGGAQKPATQPAPAVVIGGKKNETKSKSTRGDYENYGVDEDPTDPFYSREWGLD